MTDLKDTIKLMTSENWKDRMIAEYWQLKIRMDKLNHTIKMGIFDGEMNDTMVAQYEAMKEYANTLLHRAELCGFKDELR